MRQSSHGREMSDDPGAHPTEWSAKPIRLSLANIGPFRGDVMHTIDFRGAPGSEVDQAACNRKLADVFMLVGANGCGKTTILECIAGLLELSWGRIDGNYFTRAANKGARVLLELHIVFLIEGEIVESIIAIWIGDRRDCVEGFSTGRSASGSEWQGEVGFVAPSCQVSYLDKQGAFFLEVIRKTESAIGNLPKRILPAFRAIHFDSSRGFEPWDYANSLKDDAAPTSPQSIRVNSQHDRILSNILIDMKNRDVSSFVLFLDRLSERVFTQFGVNKRFVYTIVPFSYESLSTIINVDPGPHRLPERVRRFTGPKSQHHGLHQLSRGEQNLFRLYAWLEIRPGQPLLLLIDEIGSGLHDSHKEILLSDLDRICSISTRSTILFTTHDELLIKKYVEGGALPWRGGAVLEFHEETWSATDSR